MSLVPVMNDTKWDEICRGMHELGQPWPRWRARYRGAPTISEWDAEWYYHPRQVPFAEIEWLEIRVQSNEQRALARAVLERVHVPGSATEDGFRIVGYAAPGTAIDYL